MSQDATQTEEYQTERLAGGTRYVLPPRKLGKLRPLGCGLTVMGLFVVGFMGVWMAGPLIAGIKMLGENEWFGVGLIAFAMFGLAGLVPAGLLLVAGLTVLGNRSQAIVEVRDGKLYANERLLIGTWRRKRDIREVQRLIVETANSLQRRRAGSGASTRGFEQLGGAILADGPNMKKLVVAPGYPPELLERLARELAPQIDAEADLSAMAGGDASRDVEVSVSRPPVEVALGQADYRTSMPTQPAVSDATIERRDDGVTISIPPAGVWKGSKGLFAFSLAWNAFIGIFVAAFAAIALSGKLQDQGDDLTIGAIVIMVGVLGIFVAVGVATLLTAINMGRRKAMIATSGRRMLFVRDSIFGRKQQEWTADQIERICCGPSGMEVNNVPIRELQIHPRGGDKFGALSQRDDREIEWIAAELNASLGLVDYGGEGRTPAG